MTSISGCFVKEDRSDKAGFEMDSASHSESLAIDRVILK